MAETVLNDVETPTEQETTKTELTEAQGLAVHLMQERELRQATVLEMNDLLKRLDEALVENASLKRTLYQERLNAISRDNTYLRTRYELPSGNANYSIENGKMFLIEAAAPAPKLEADEGK